ncbi:hypothetical protein BD309DRAFT_974531 [Dichomitus squalens]|uniref:Uncharacterized protein n=1 Tax=Dichomitus squalens TaxID=114155 RepID=A0A4Q9NDH3_9APHY|nr:hypothetical protein BD309DRAFT_974531 [Dichomitus squalens]TBU56951.1 hypothetical protein BD310DRAFT_930342 [Dichomitus squalens]
MSNPARCLEFRVPSRRSARTCAPSRSAAKLRPELSAGRGRRQATRATPPTTGSIHGWPYSLHTPLSSTYTAAPFTLRADSHLRYPCMQIGYCPQLDNQFSAFLGYAQAETAMIRPALADQPAINRCCCERRHLPPRSRTRNQVGEEVLARREGRVVPVWYGATMGAACIVKHTRCL